MAGTPADKWDIYAVLVDYADALDRRDVARAARCFAPDASAVYSGVSVGPGRAAIAEFLTRNLTSLASTHFVGNVRVDFATATSATSDSFVMATHVVNVDGVTRLRIRGLRYLDTFALLERRWSIVNRVHVPVWATEVDGELL
jgi:hypothetical protein